MRWHRTKRFSLIWLYCIWRIYFRYIKVWIHCNQNVGDICLNRKAEKGNFHLLISFNAKQGKQEKYSMDRNLQFSYKQDFTIYISSPNLNIFWFYRAHHFSSSKEILIKYLFWNICSYAVIPQSFQSQHLKKKKKTRSYFTMSLWLIKK